MLVVIAALMLCLAPALRVTPARRPFHMDDVAEWLLTPVPPNLRLAQLASDLISVSSSDDAVDDPYFEYVPEDVDCENPILVDTPEEKQTVSENKQPKSFNDTLLELDNDLDLAFAPTPVDSPIVKEEEMPPPTTKELLEYTEQELLEYIADGVKKT